MEFKEQQYPLLHECILYLLKNIASFCDEHQLSYILDFGTLLGAVRNGKIIPWDDDGDIGMPRNDFEKFIELFPKFNKNSYLDFQYYSTDPCHNVPWCRIRLKGTICLSDFHKRSNFKYKGIWVGIFPHDTSITNNPKDLMIRLNKINFWQRVYMNKTFNRESFKAKFFYLLTPFLTKQLAIKKINAAYKMFSRNSDDEYDVHSFLSDKKRIYLFKNDVFVNRMQIKLENSLFYCPKSYDSYLKSIYGENYIIPPSLKERVTHSIVEFNVSDEVLKIIYEEK